MLLLTGVYIYSGIEQSFFLGIYSTCVSFTQQLGTHLNEFVAFNVIAIGIGTIVGKYCYCLFNTVSSSGSGLFGILGKKTIKFGRFPIVLLGFVIQTACFVLVYLNIPANATLHKTNDQSIIHPPG